MKISRIVGTTNEVLQIFVQDATVSTGIGLPNLVISTFSTYWIRSDMTSTSSLVMTSTGVLGTYSSGTWTQVNSTFMRGWYQLGAPQGLWAAGRTAGLHLYGHPSMAPVPIEVEITRTDNQNYVSTQPYNVERVYQSAAVTSFAGVFTVGVSTNADKFGYGVSSNADKTNYGISSFGFQVGVSTFNSRVGVSSFGLPVGVSSFNVGLQVGVSSFGIPVGVSSLDVPLSVGVSSFGIPVGVSSVADKTGYSVTGLNPALLDASVSSRLAALSYTVPPTPAQNADGLLIRNVSSGADGGREVRQALYVLRNKVDAAAGIVYQTDDTASSWSFTVSTVAGDPIVAILPI